MVKNDEDYDQYDTSVASMNPTRAPAVPARPIYAVMVAISLLSVACTGGVEDFDSYESDLADASQLTNTRPTLAVNTAIDIADFSEGCAQVTRSPAQNLRSRKLTHNSS